MMGTMVQKPAKLILAEKRYKYESNDYRCLSTPIFQKGVDDSIIRISDETLAPKKSRLFTLDEDMTVILIPLVGKITFEAGGTNCSMDIDPEEMMVRPLKKGDYFSIKNPNNSELVNYLQIWLKYYTAGSKISFAQYKNNSLNPIFESPCFKLHFAVMDGRTEAELAPESNRSTIINFVINGVFEVQNRLLESRDCLAIKNIETLEMEALSENAIILVLEKKNTC